MSTPKSESPSLVDREVEIFLKTPLFRFRFVRDGREEELMENAVRIGGRVIREGSAGLWIKVKSVSNQKSAEKNPPFSEILIPSSKIDFVVVA